MIWLLLAGCPEVEEPPEVLSDLGLFEYADGEFDYADGIVPYDLNTPLFSDWAIKDRAIDIPEGAATYEPDASFDFPVGTTLIKSFSFVPDLRYPDEGRRIVETRLLVREEDGWDARPYLWDEDETDATYEPGGRVIPMDVIDRDGQALSFAYLVPQRNQCAMCHELAEPERTMTPIGTKARHLARTNTYDGVEVDQLQYLADQGLLTGLPETIESAFDLREVEARGVADLSPEETEKAARDWLDVNCAHCHNPDGGAGIASQLFLNHDNEDAFHLGVCKTPGAAGTGGAGRTYDLVPGDHDASILWYRMSTTQVGDMMPQIGRATAYPTASELVARWIDEMEGGCD